MANQRTQSNGVTRSAVQEQDRPVVVFDHVKLAFDDNVVLKDVSFTLLSGRTKIILGASGSGKSTTLKIITGLLRADAGAITVNGQRVDQLTETEMMAVRADLGMIFQEGALFDSLTVRENVGYKLFEESDMPLDEANRRVEEVLGFVGLSEFIDRMPSALSGGQRRRVAIARAMAFKPKILLYDEATTGLDPITAITVNRWPHGYAPEHNSLWEPELPEGEQPQVLGRARFGRIAIANSDSGGGAYTDVAIDQAHRAVGELLGNLPRV